MLATVALAWAGMIVGHVVSYVLAYPAEEEREAHLLVTGHGSFRFALMSLVAVIPAVLLVTVLRAVSSDHRPKILRTALVLAALQVPAFALLELVERDLSLAQALTDRAHVVGLVVQVLGALLSSVVIAMLFRGVRVLAARLRRAAFTAPESTPRPRRRETARRLILLVSARLRAPPLRLAA